MSGANGHEANLVKPVICHKLPHWRRVYEATILLPLDIKYENSANIEQLIFNLQLM